MDMALESSRWDLVVGAICSDGIWSWEPSGLLAQMAKSLVFLKEYKGSGYSHIASWAI
jgi:hypothetical protein